jgi:hypothetical protein
MSIRRISTVAAAVAALAAVLPATSSADCVPGKAKVLDMNKSVVVYAQGTKVKGCYQKTSRTTPLNALPNSRLRAAGRYVAYVYVNDPAGPAGSDPGKALEVWDLRGGELVTKIQIDAEDDFIVYVTGDLELTKSGTAAWTAEDGLSKERHVVQAAKGAKSFTTLDTGKDLVLDSLAISGTHVFWLNGTTPKVATLA